MARIVEESLSPGTRLEDMVIKGVLGQGGFGVTYRAHSSTLDADVVIKEFFPQQFARRDDDGNVVPGNGAEDAEFFAEGRSRFLDEARALARLTRAEGATGLIPVLRYFEVRKTAYFVMPHIEGRTLSEQIADQGALDVDALMVVTEHLLNAAEQVHSADLMHRDITPGNVLMRPNGEPLLFDFGLVRSLVDPRKSRYPIFSDGYAAPEQYDVSSQQGPWTDIYGLAATFYTAAAGETPQSAAGRLISDKLRPLADIADNTLDPNFIAFVERGLALDPTARQVSITEWRASLTGDTRTEVTAASHLVLDQAWELLSTGKIDNGRSVLEDHCRRDPEDTEAAAMLAIELFRPPVDYGPAIRHQNMVINEYGSHPAAIPLDIISSVEWGHRGSIKQTLRKLALSDPPTSVHGAWMRALAEVYATDERIQAEVFDEQSTTIASNIMVAAAYLVRGCPRAAKREFTKVIDRPERSIKSFKSRYPGMSAKRRKLLEERIVEAARLGLLLAERDLGRAGNTVAGWQTLNGMRPGWPAGSEFLMTEARCLAGNKSASAGPDRDPEIIDESAWGNMVFNHMRDEETYNTSVRFGWVTDVLKIVAVGALIATAVFIFG